MFFLWRKKGLLVPLAVVLGFVPLIALAAAGIGAELPAGSFVSRFIGFLSLPVMFLPALFNFLFTKYFLKDEGVKIVTDEDGKEYQLNNFSSFFFIKNKTWTTILILFPLITLINSFFR